MPRRREGLRNDLLGGGRRLVMEARGMYRTIVNGQVLYREGKPTGARPGTVFRCSDC